MATPTKMGALLIALRIASIFVASAWLLLHSLALYVLAESGRWPMYGNPESWSMPLFDDAQMIYFAITLLVVLAYCASLVGVLAIPASYLYLTLRHRQYSFRIFQWVAFAMFFIFLLDPGELVPWLVD